MPVFTIFFQYVDIQLKSNWVISISSGYSNELIFVFPNITLPSWIDGKSFEFKEKSTGLKKLLGSLFLLLDNNVYFMVYLFSLHLSRS